MSDLREGLLFPNLLTRSERRELDREPEPRFLYQSMGAGWQSTAIALLAAQGVIEKPRFAVCRGTGTVRKVGAPPQGVWARSYVGFSADEMGRISPSRVSYAFDTFPLVGRDQNGEVVPPDLSMSRHDCGEYNTRHGFPEVMKSACIGCPWHSDAEWIRIKQDERQWQQVVDLDRSIRNTPGLDNEAFLHKSRIPIEDVTFESADDVERPSCSPYGCRS
ncbi:hypothetical protein P5V38_26740, partial [Mycobacteroides abscessus subsp. abscessus]|nr:hypothetical protein [Mycobacteroides abscessus subsp. abscessus]